MNSLQDPRCPRCDAQQLMFPIEVGGDTETPIPLQLKLKPPKEPGAWLDSRSPDRFTLRAAVCGQCGYTEFYADRPNEIWRKWQAGAR